MVFQLELCHYGALRSDDTRGTCQGAVLFPHYTFRDCRDTDVSADVTAPDWVPPSVCHRTQHTLAAQRGSLKGSLLRWGRTTISAESMSGVEAEGHWHGIVAFQVPWRALAGDDAAFVG
jgi:hypothetical protein